MFRFGVIGMQRPSDPRAAKDPRQSPPQTGRLLIMCVAFVVVGGVAAGFLVKGPSDKGSRSEDVAVAEERNRPAGGPLKAIPMHQLRVTQVEDPGDPYEDGAAQDPPAGAAPWRGGCRISGSMHLRRVSKR